MNEVNPYKSIPASLYWCIVTLTTVGYGDYVPVTDAGRCVGFLTILCGVVVLAMPLSIIGSNFHEVQGQMKELEQEKAASEDTAHPNPIDGLYDCAEACEKADSLQEVSISMGDAMFLFMQEIRTPIHAVLTPYERHMNAI
jgi:hypothetical protein